MTPKQDSVLVLGGTGMAGAAIIRALSHAGYTGILHPGRSTLDLLDYHAVTTYMAANPADLVIMAAARVGGIMANMNNQALFYAENARMSMNVIQAAAGSGVPRLVYLGSSCVYPKHASQPIAEQALLTGPLEPTNEGYALAKIGGIKMCSYYRKSLNLNYFSVMPTNLYGPGDNYHPTESHVIPALIRRIHEAKATGAPEVVIWGSGKVLREFMHVNDLADAIVHLAGAGEHPDLVNIGSGREITIADLAGLIVHVTGYAGSLVFDTSKPDGTPRKLMDSSYLYSTGWKPSLDLEAGLRRTYRDFLEGRGRNI